MKKLVTICPSCQGAMKISALTCDACGLEVKGDFEISPYDQLNETQSAFLLCFLRNKGNLKQTQDAWGVSYPTAKKLLDELLAALGLAEPAIPVEMEAPDMTTWTIDSTSTKASQIIRTKLIEAGGSAIIRTARGLPCDIRISPDGKSIISNKLPLKPPYRLEVFDLIVDLLMASGGRAPKGNGRNYKLGEPMCDDSTVVGYIASHYAHKQPGMSVFDPVFVFAAVLEWAGIAHNGHGELSLTASYRSLLAQK